MATFKEKCYQCGKQCLNVEFCNDGALYDAGDQAGLSLPRNIKVKVIANPAFWGFGGTLIEGWAHFDNGHFDFYDGFDKDHKSLKSCGPVTVGPYKNEARPDVMYRSVYDPQDASVVHYGSDGLVETGTEAERGGAEVYLIDRPAGIIDAVAGDGSSCDQTNPLQVFRKMPDNFGLGNKIYFDNGIYKNATGAWRLYDNSSCYDTTFTTPGGPDAFLHQCTGVDKQNLRQGDNYLQYYEPGRIRAGSLSDCGQDGSVALEYSGVVNTVVLDTGISPFAKVTMSYGSVAASGLKNGMDIFFTNTHAVYNKTYKIFDVTHAATETTATLVGTNAESAINIAVTGNWVALGTYDPDTCCGGVAHGIDGDLKNFSNEQNYHSDFRRVFNNPKNLRQSDRFPENREVHNLPIPTLHNESGSRIDYSYPSVSGVSGVAETGVSGVPVFERELAYYGPYHEVDQYDDAQRFSDKKNTIKSKNGTCYSKSASLEVFPDCVTQYDEYTNCLPSLTHTINRFPRLAFVFRGCNFDEECSYDSSGRPLGDDARYGGWATHGAPQNLEDLRRGLPGQEINMFVNLGTARAALVEQCECPCPPDTPVGTDEPVHIEIPSPVTFPCLPDFDLYPERFGCQDVRYQMDKYREYHDFFFEHEACAAFPEASGACYTRQPYTTYGYISHLCGSETESSKEVIKNSFANLAQGGEYTNLTPGSGVNQEPMYWSFECDVPEPYNPSGNAWGTFGFNNNGGGQQPYWGLSAGRDTTLLQSSYETDSRLIAPYYYTKSGVSDGCCGGEGQPTADFSASGNFFNAEPSDNSGWPTDSVPFLIEIETSDLCVGCATTNMPTGNLTISLSSLDSEFYYGDGCTAGDCYGFNECKYKGPHAPPTYYCNSGFRGFECTPGSEEYKTFGSARSDQTCECIDGTSFTLTPVIIQGSELPIGWRSSGFDGTSLVEAVGCLDIPNSYLDVDYFSTPAAGVTQFMSIKLACPENIGLLDEPVFPFAFYEGNALANLWGCGGCSHHQPASIGTGGDLSLQVDYWTVPLAHRELFQSFTEPEINALEGAGGLLNYPDAYAGGIIAGNVQVCSGDYILHYGCYGVDASGDPAFHGCGMDCTDATVCNTCDVVCNDCGEIESVNYPGNPPVSVATQRVPINWDLESCGCLCIEPTLYSINLVTGHFSFGGVDSIPTTTETWRHAEACSGTTELWHAVSGGVGSGSNSQRVIGPWNLNVGPPNPYIGIKNGTRTAVDWFSFSHGANSGVDGIDYRLIEAGKGDCDVLTPTTCSTGNCLDPRANSSMCGSPVPITAGSGQPWTDSSLTVRKKSCFPEIMSVNKIVCNPGGTYDLSVSREYHSHNRGWKHSPTVDCACIPLYAGSYQYVSGSDSGCVSIPYAVPSDGVTPASDAPCSINPSSGDFVNQDFTFNTKAHASGDTTWNYYNLFYTGSGSFPNGQPGINESGTYLSSIYIEWNSDFGCGPVCGQQDGTLTLDTVFMEGTGLFNTPAGRFGVDATNKRHSCLQDIKECGGDLFCNKMFFPRRFHATNTLVAPFGSMQICTPNADLTASIGTRGYENFDTTPDIIKEVELYRHVDVCDPNITVELQTDVDIDDTVITVLDYLPLMGIVHPGWKNTTNVQSCTILETGNCGGSMPPTYSDVTIQSAVHTPLTFGSDGKDAMGYYLDKKGVASITGLGAKASDSCLFKPFNIMVDVECSTNNIGRKNITPDDPTLLTFVLDAPPASCNGYNWAPPCGCADSPCASNILNPPGCVEIKPISAVYDIVPGRVCNSGGAIEDICGVSGVDWNAGGILVPGADPDGLFGKYILSNNAFNPLTPLDISGYGGLGIQEQVCQGSDDSVPGGGGGGSVTVSGACILGSGYTAYTFCDGAIVEVGPVQYLPLWECGDKQYIPPIPTPVLQSGCCDNVETLCSATNFSETGVDCDNVIVSDWAAIPSGSTYWENPCGCKASAVPGNGAYMYPCENDSKLKAIITEA